MEHSKVFSMVSFCTLPTPKRHQRVGQALHWGPEGITTELERLLVTLLIRASLSVQNLHRRKFFQAFGVSGKAIRIKLILHQVQSSTLKRNGRSSAGLICSLLHCHFSIRLVSTTDKEKECYHVTGRGLISFFSFALLQLVINKLIYICGTLSKALAQEIHFQY